MRARPESSAKAMPTKGPIWSAPKIPVSMSYTAGSYVCNSVFYGVRHFIEENQLSVRAGFVDLPCLPEQILEPNAPCIDMQVQLKALRTIVAVLSQSND